MALYHTAPLRGNDKNHKFTNGSGDGTVGVAATGDGSRRYISYLQAECGSIQVNKVSMTA